MTNDAASSTLYHASPLGHVPLLLLSPTATAPRIQVPNNQILIGLWSRMLETISLILIQK
jgi:hypothetical protein